MSGGAPIGNSNGKKWPLEHWAALQEFLKEGMSASEIAAAMNAKFLWRTSYTRNSVIGRINRQGLKLSNTQPPRRKNTGPKPWEQAGISKRHYKRLQAKKRAGTSRSPSPPLAIVWPPALPAARNVALVDLAPDDCRWPGGEPVAFCGAMRLPQDELGRRPSYCFHHHRMSLRGAGRD